MKITCDNCGYGFSPMDKMLLEQRHPDGLIEAYYDCPKCKKRFHVCWHNAETKRLQKLIRHAVNAGNMDKAKEYRRKLKTALDALNNRL